jgi:hypothetical protein
VVLHISIKLIFWHECEILFRINQER